MLKLHLTQHSHITADHDMFNSVPFSLSVDDPDLDNYQCRLIEGFVRIDEDGSLRFGFTHVGRPDFYNEDPEHIEVSVTHFAEVWKVCIKDTVVGVLPSYKAAAGFADGLIGAGVSNELITVNQQYS